MQQLRRCTTTGGSRSLQLFCERYHATQPKQNITPSIHGGATSASRRWKSSNSASLLQHHFEEEKEMRHQRHGPQHEPMTTNKEELVQNSIISMSSNYLPNFNNATFHQAKSSWELLRGYSVFSTCQFPWIVNNAETLLQLSYLTVGQTMTNTLLQQTFYGHFCAGENEHQVRPVIMDMKQNHGIGAILDYAAEADIEADENNDADTNKKSTTANDDAYNSKIEKQCDENVKVFEKCIRTAADASSNDAYAAIKVTALGNPKLLQKLSVVIQEFQNLYSEIIDENGVISISDKEMERGYKLLLNKPSNDEEANNILLTDDIAAFLQTKKNDPKENHEGMTTIDFPTWSTMFNPRELPKLLSYECKKQRPFTLLSTPITQEEITLWSSMFERAERIAEEALRHDTRLLFDAEQFRYQPAIDLLVGYLQRKYNTNNNQPIIYNTYQCYLKDTKQRLERDLERAEKFGYSFGAKLVRGAYMESERELAQKNHYQSPIHDTIQDTHDCYDACVELLMQHQKCRNNIGIDIMLATHNQTSIEKVIRNLGDNDNDSNAKNNISFAQLYGMSDHLTYNLAQHGFRVYKYLPYGPIHEVMPYLVRRAQENSAITNGGPEGGASKELEMIQQELKRRVKL